MRGEERPADGRSAVGERSGEVVECRHGQQGTVAPARGPARTYYSYSGAGCGIAAATAAASKERTN